MTPEEARARGEEWYPELSGRAVDAATLLAWVALHHDHLMEDLMSGEDRAVVYSAELEALIRAEAGPGDGEREARMENPGTWGEAERIVDGVLRAWEEMLARPAHERPVGLSRARQVTDALRGAGLLRDQPAGAGAGLSRQISELAGRIGILEDGMGGLRRDLEASRREMTSRTGDPRHAAGGR